MRATGGGSVIDGAIGRPAPALRSFVDAYAGSWFEGLRPGSHQGLPSGSMTLIIGLGEAIDIAAMPDAAQAPQAFDAFVGGLHSSPATVRYETTMRCVSVKLSPLGSRALLGSPAGELASTVVDLREVIGRAAGELVDRLGSASSWDERFAALDDVFCRVAREAAQTPPALSWAWRRLAASAGRVRIAALAEESGLSRRHLGERFRAEFGISPKVATRVLRFDRARRLLRASHPPQLAAVAAACGYSDQAHMCHEWRELAGDSPTAWLRSEELPNLQDGEARDVQSCAHEDAPRGD
jgi:AraC-like DNA-binding protein